MLAFLRSFRFAFRGLCVCLRERNFRFHMTLSAYMYGFLLLHDWFVLTRGEWAALVLITALVLGVEALNTAIEAAVDLACPQRHPLAARAKDAGAAAVLLCSVGAIAVGVVLLWQPEAFRAMFEYYQVRPAMLIPLAVSLIGAAWFIWGVGRKTV